MATWRLHRRESLAVVVVAALLVRAFVVGEHIPLLSYVDLGFHELGHMLAIPLGTVVHFLAGSVAQIAIPAGLAAYFWHRTSDRTAAGVMLAWAATSAQNVSVYMADAPYRRLPLIGGTHDWWFLLGRWDSLDVASGLAAMVWFIGLLMGLAGLAVCGWPLYAGLSSFLCEVVVHVVGSRRPGKVMANALSACFHPWVRVPSSPPLLFPMLRIAK